MKTLRMPAVLIIVSLLLTGCFVNDDVAVNEQGIVLYGGAFQYCLAPGVHSDWDFYADLVEVSMDTIAVEVSDPEVVTSPEDQKVVGVTVVVQVRRKSDCESLKTLLSNYGGLLNNDQVVVLVSSWTNEAIKNGTRQYSLQGLLNDRDGLATKILTALQLNATDASLQVVSVSVKNVDVDDTITTEWQKQAQIAEQVKTALRDQERIKQEAANAILAQEQKKLELEAQLKREEAQTQIDIEIAERAGQVVTAQNAVYASNPQAYELQRLRLLKDVLGGESVIYFVSDLAELNLILGANGQPVLPLPDEPAP